MPLNKTCESIVNSSHRHITFAPERSTLPRRIDSGSFLTLPAVLDRCAFSLSSLRRSTPFHLPLPIPPWQTTGRSGLRFLNVPLRHFSPYFFKSLFGSYTDFDHYASPQDDHRDNKKNSNRVTRRVVWTFPRTVGESPQLMGVGTTFVTWSGRVGRFGTRFQILKQLNASYVSTTGQIEGFGRSGKVMQGALTRRNGRPSRPLAEVSSRLRSRPYWLQCLLWTLTFSVPNLKPTKNNYANSLEGRQ